MSNRFTVKFFVWMFVLLLVLAAPASAAPKKVEGVAFSWKNMGLMGPGYESAHRISVTRASSGMQHTVEYHEGKIVQKTIVYRTDDAARFRFLDVLSGIVERWIPEYAAGVLDGSSWAVVVHYAGHQEYKEFKGYGETPPHADEIKRLILGLADFETFPKFF